MTSTLKIVLSLLVVITTIILVLFIVISDSSNKKSDKRKSINQLIHTSNKEKLSLSKDQKKELKQYGHIGKNENRIVYIFVDLECVDCKKFEKTYGHKFREETHNISYQYVPAPVLGGHSKKLAKKQIILNERSPQQGNKFVEKALRGSEDNVVANFKDSELKRYQKLDPSKTSDKLGIHSTPYLIYKEHNEYYKIN